jgi:HSP20 family protein
MGDAGVTDIQRSFTMFALNTRPRTVATYGREPFGLLDAMIADWLTQRPASALVSRAKLEVSERDGSYEVRAELPGASKDAITVDVDGAWVSISAGANAQSDKKDGEKLLYTERHQESFARSFELPQAVNSDAAQATFENGVLKLTLPKKDAPKARRLAIQ